MFLHGYRQALAALVSNAESAPSSSRRRRTSAGSEQSLQGLSDQLHRAKEVLAVYVQMLHPWLSLVESGA